MLIYDVPLVAYDDDGETYYKGDIWANQIAAQVQDTDDPLVTEVVLHSGYVLYVNMKLESWRKKVHKAFRDNLLRGMS